MRRGMKPRARQGSGRIAHRAVPHAGGARGVGRQGTGDPTGVTLMTVHMAKASNGRRDARRAPRTVCSRWRDRRASRGTRGGATVVLRGTHARARKTVSLMARTRYRTGRLELSEPSRFLEALRRAHWRSGARRHVGRGARGGRGAARGGRSQRARRRSWIGRSRRRRTRRATRPVSGCGTASSGAGWCGGVGVRPRAQGNR